MAKFCGKCGARLDEITGQCPVCNKSIHADKITRNFLHKRKKRAVILVVLFAICVCVVLVLLGKRTLLEFKTDAVDETIAATVPPETPLQATVVKDAVIPESSAEVDIVSETVEEVVPAANSVAVTEPESTITLKTVSMQPYGDPVSSVSASSTFSSDHANHDAENLRDNDPKTNWAEGVDGYGIGESVRFDFHETVQLNGFQICGGNQYDYDCFKDNCRPEWIKLTFADGASESFRLKDMLKSQTFELSAPVETDSVVLTVNTIYEGRKYEDTVISDVSFDAFVMHGEQKVIPSGAEECTYLKVATVLDYDSNGNSTEYGVVTAYDETKAKMWTYESGKYNGGAQCGPMWFVGTYGNTLYISENGTLFALDMTSGTIKWKNKQFGGIPTACAFDKNGTLYLTGYLSPDLFIADKFGDTVFEISTFDDRYYWPSAITLEDSFAFITMDGHPEEVKGENSIIIVDLADFSYEIPQS